MPLDLSSEQSTQRPGFVVPIFVNAIHVPAPSPRRCYFYGQTIRRAIESYAGIGPVAIYASGGMSHFTAGYPWRNYQGSYTHGSISEDFDRWLMERMRAGEGHTLAELTNDQIIGNGEIELRSWISALGAMGNSKTRVPDTTIFLLRHYGYGGRLLGPRHVAMKTKNPSQCKR